jgi:hypothetical protein
MTMRHEEPQPNYPVDGLPSKSKPQRLKEKAKAKTKKVLNIDSSDDDEVEETPQRSCVEGNQRNSGIQLVSISK